MASGDIYPSLCLAFKVSVPVISRTIPKVTKAIINKFAPDYIKLPNSQEQWKKEAKRFGKRYNNFSFEMNENQIFKIYKCILVTKYKQFEHSLKGKLKKQCQFEHM